MTKKKWKPGEFEARTQELLRLEAKKPYLWYWCSFALPKGGFLGVVILQAHGVVECSIRARALGSNPGGEVVAVPLSPHSEHLLPPPEYRNRLLSQEEVEKLWPDTKTI
jgi:hypothetical protein